jgi:membrane protease YdiL (CAAX protease family)
MTTASSEASDLAPIQSDAADAKIPNSFGKLAVARAFGRLSWTWPLVFCLIRFPLLVAGFAVAFWAYHSNDSGHAGELAQAFTRYNMPLLADVVCIGLLMWRVRREGMTLKDLVRPTRQHLVRDLIRGVLILAPVACLVGVFNVFYAILSPSSALQGVGAASLLNPLGTTWHVAITLLIIPISSGITEELVYRGYALPRLQALTGRRWLAIGITALGFGLQHVAFALVDWRLAMIGGISMMMLGAAYGIFYFAARQRLLPLILVHWQADFVSLGLAPLLLALMGVA